MDKLTEQEEKKITEMIAETFHFELKGKGAVCRHCGLRFQSYATGKHINDRMIQHGSRHGIGVK